MTGRNRHLAVAAALGVLIGGLLNVFVAPVESSDEATGAPELIRTS